MTHPIAPPPELLQQWLGEQPGCAEQILATKAAQWGADQELEACREYLVRCAQWEPEDVDDLRAARRPKPPSLKEQGKAAISRFRANAHTTANEMMADFDLLQRALDQLDD